MYIFEVPLEIKDEKVLKQICERFDCEIEKTHGYYYEIKTSTLENIFWLGANLHNQLMAFSNEKS